MKNGLLIFSAPSGSGKSTIVNWLMKEHPELKLAFSISCTSRAPRGTEQNISSSLQRSLKLRLKLMNSWNTRRFIKTDSMAP